MQDTERFTTQDVPGDDDTSDIEFRDNLRNETKVVRKSYRWPEAFQRWKAEQKQKSKGKVAA